MRLKGDTDASLMQGNLLKCCRVHIRGVHSNQQSGFDDASDPCLSFVRRLLWQAGRQPRAAPMNSRMWLQCGVIYPIIHSATMHCAACSARKRSSSHACCSHALHAGLLPIGGLNTSLLSCSAAADGSLSYVAQCCRSLARPIQRMYGSREVVIDCVPNRFADSLPVGAGLGEVNPAIHPALRQAPSFRSSMGERKTPLKLHRVDGQSEHTGGHPTCSSQLPSWRQRRRHKCAAPA